MTVYDKMLKPHTKLTLDTNFSRNELLKLGRYFFLILI